MKVEIYGNPKQNTKSGSTVSFIADDASPVTSLDAEINPSVEGNASVVITANGEDTEVNLTKSVYGGNVNVTSGVVTETYGGGAYDPANIPADLKNIVDANTTEETASGDIASFNCELGEYPITDLTASINSIQDLHGYDSPWPAGGGKNKLQVTTTSGVVNGVTITVNDDGSIKLVGTATANLTILLNENLALESASWIFSGEGFGSLTGSNGGVFASSGTGVTTDAINNKRDGDYAFSGTVGRIWLYFNNGTVFNNTLKLMIRPASIADNTWQPYANICPISGWTGCEVTRTGKNLFSSKVVHGLWTTTTFYSHEGASSKYLTSRNKIPLVGGRSYVVSFENDPNNVVASGQFIAYRGETAVNAATWLNVNTGIINVPSGADSIAINLLLTNNITHASEVTTKNYQLELGSTATAYEPYQGETYTIQLGGTRYGGTLDVTTGKLTVTHGIKLVKYSEGQALTIEGVFLFRCTINDIKNAPLQRSFICSHFFKPSGYIGQTPSQNGMITNQYYNSYNVCMRNDALTTAGEWQTWLAAQEANGTPVQIVYELATPIVIDNLDPVTIETLLGTNNVWSDTGAVEVTYRDGNVSAMTELLTDSTALTTGENVSYPLEESTTYSIARTPIMTVAGENTMSANTGNITVTWSTRWFDITPWIAWQGLTFSRNDVDAPDAGRDMSGLMHRGRVAVKEKMNIQTIQLTRAQSSFLQTLLYPMTIRVRVTPYPRTNDAHTMSMYTNNVKTTYVIHRENGEDLQSLSFPLIEN